MKCSFCSSDIPKNHTVCSSCGAQLVYRSEANFRKSKSGSFVMFGIWCNSVGLVWGIILFATFYPAWTIFVNGQTFFPRTEWYCDAMYERTQHNNIKFPNAPKHVSSKYFTVGKTKTDSFPFFGEETPNCNILGWRETVEKSNNQDIDSVKKMGIRMTYRIISEPKARKIITRSTAILDTEKPIMKDYIFSIIWPCIALLFGIPIGRAANWMWEKLFGSGSDLVWIR